MFTRLPRSGPDTGHMLVVSFSRFLPAQLFWDPIKPSCQKECAPVRRKPWRAGYPNWSRTLPLLPAAPPSRSPPTPTPGQPPLLSLVLQRPLPSTAPRGRLFSTWQALFQPEVGAVYCLISSPAGLRGIPLDTSAAKANGTASHFCAFLPAFLIFLLCLEKYSLLTPRLRSPIFERRRLEGPGEDLVGVVFLSEEVNAGRYGVKS